MYNHKNPYLGRWCPTLRSSSIMLLVLLEVEPPWEGRSLLATKLCRVGYARRNLARLGIILLVLIWIFYHHGVCNWLVGMLQTFLRASTKDWLGLFWTSLGLAGIWGVLGKRMWAREKSMDIGGSVILGQQCLDSSFSGYLCRRFHGKKKIIITYKIENFMSWFCF